VPDDEALSAVFVTRYTIFDGGSDDGSLEILLA
jgi:hypothetical protein